MNKNLLYYFFCVDIKDFVFQGLDMKGNTHYACLPKFICIKTYFPCFEFYKKILRDIFDYVIAQRTSFARMDKNVADVTLAGLTNMKFEFEDFRIENQKTKTAIMLVNLHRLEIKSQIPREISFAGSDKPIQMPVDQCKHRNILEVNYGRLRL